MISDTARFHVTNSFLFTVAAYTATPPTATSPPTRLGALAASPGADTALDGGAVDRRADRYARVGLRITFHPDRGTIILAITTNESSAAGNHPSERRWRSVEVRVA